MTKIEELRAAYEAAMKPLPRWTEGEGKATHAYMKEQTLPATLWETTYIWHGERLYRVEVTPIKVVKYDLLPGAWTPTVEFKDAAGRRARGSVEMYYVSKEAAQAEADYVMANQAKDETNAHLITLMHNNLPALLEAVEAIPEVIRISDRKHDAWDRVKAALEKLK